MIDQFDGSGYAQYLRIYCSRAVSISFKSLCLIVFLLSFEYHWNDKKAIVQSIARIVITTISSTRVKAFFELVICFILFLLIPIPFSYKFFS